MALTNDVITDIGADVRITDVISDVVSELDVVSLLATPAPTTVDTGTPTRQLTATATFSNGESLNVTAAASWVSATPAAATVSAGGLVTKVATGSSVITATYGGKSATSTVTVT